MIEISFRHSFIPTLFKNVPCRDQIGLLTVSDWLSSSQATGLSRGVNWQPPRSRSPLTRTKRSRQIQRSADHKWDFPASHLSASIAQQNHLLEIMPVYNKRHVLKGKTSRQAGGRAGVRGEIPFRQLLKTQWRTRDKHRGAARVL